MPSSKLKIRASGVSGRMPYDSKIRSQKIHIFLFLTSPKRNGFKKERLRSDGSPPKPKENYMEIHLTTSIGQDPLTNSHSKEMGGRGRGGDFVTLKRMYDFEN